MKYVLYCTVLSLKSSMGYFIDYTLAVLCGCVWAESTHPSTHPPTHPSTHPPIHPSIHPSILPIYCLIIKLQKTRGTFSNKKETKYILLYRFFSGCILAVPKNRCQECIYLISTGHLHQALSTVGVHQTSRHRSPYDPV